MEERTGDGEGEREYDGIIGGGGGSNDILLAVLRVKVKYLDLQMIPRAALLYQEIHLEWYLYGDLLQQWKKMHFLGGVFSRLVVLVVYI